VGRNKSFGPVAVINHRSFYINLCFAICCSESCSILPFLFRNTGRVHLIQVPPSNSMAKCKTRTHIPLHTHILTLTHTETSLLIAKNMKTTFSFETWLKRRNQRICALKAQCTTRTKAPSVSMYVFVCVDVYVHGSPVLCYVQQHA